MVRALLLALCALVLAGAGAPPARSQQAVTVQINSVDAGSFPQIRATVTVLDGTQRPILSLDQKAFGATVAGDAVPVTGVASAADEGLGIAVVLTFDVSGSMEGAPLAAAKEAGKALVSQISVNDQAAIVAFSDNVTAVLPFTQDRAALTAAIDGLVSGGNTALYSAVVSSAETARAAALPRHAVVLLSDGTDFGGGSQTDAAGSLAAARDSGVPFFVAGLGEEIDKPYLEQLASASRGQLLLAAEPEALASLYENIGAILRYQYVLALDASAFEGAAGAALTVSVSAAGASGSASTVLELPATPVAAATPAPSPSTAGTEPATGQRPAGSGGPGLVVLIAVAAGLAGVAVLLVAFFRRRRRDRGEGADLVMPRREDAGPVFQPIEVAVTPAASGAYVEVLLAEGAMTFPVGETATVGYTPDCSVRLEDGSTTRWEIVRIWRREGRYMVHNLSRIGTVTIAGKRVTWAVLEDGDELEIGPQRVVFHEKPK